MPARAVEAITLRAGEPDSVVVANVVRVIAADSGPAATSALVSTGRSRSALAISGLRRQRGVRGEAPEQLDGRVGDATPASGARSTRRMARASRAVGPNLAGVEACPPRPSTRSTTLVVPFSVTPIAPTGGLMPGERVARDRAALVDHEPRLDPAAGELGDGLEGRRTATPPRRSRS